MSVVWPKHSPLRPLHVRSNWQASLHTTDVIQPRLAMDGVTFPQPELRCHRPGEGCERIIKVGSEGYQRVEGGEWAALHSSGAEGLRI